MLPEPERGLLPRPGRPVAQPDGPLAGPALPTRLISGGFTLAFAVGGKLGEDGPAPVRTAGDQLVGVLQAPR